MNSLSIRGFALLLSAISAFSGMTTDLFAEQQTEDILMLVNREHKINWDYVPEALTTPSVLAAPGKESAIQMCPEAATALEALFIGASEAGYTLYAVSGYRSYSLQKSIFQRKVDAVGEKTAMRTVAPPGASEHQLGLAMDINGENTVSLGLVEAFGHSPEGHWVNQNAHRFGFIVRYQQNRTDITGYAWEPWHLRYVGIEAATEIYELDITFEEYHEVLQARRIENWIQPEGGE